MDYVVHGILQARILEWVAVPFSRGSSQPRDWTQVCRWILYQLSHLGSPFEHIQDMSVEKNECVEWRERSRWTDRHHCMAPKEKKKERIRVMCLDWFPDLGPLSAFFIILNMALFPRFNSFACEEMGLEGGCEILYFNTWFCRLVSGLPGEISPC